MTSILGMNVTDSFVLGSHLQVQIVIFVLETHALQLRCGLNK